MSAEGNGRVRHTPGPASITGCDQILCGYPGDMTLVAACVSVGISAEERYENAKLIVQAFDTATETGMTPVQLHEELLRVQSALATLSAERDALAKRNDNQSQSIRALTEAMQGRAAHIATLEDALRRCMSAMDESCKSGQYVADPAACELARAALRGTTP